MRGNANVKPEWTDATWPPSGSPVVTLVQARDWLGIYGDTSVDADVTACLEAAIEKVADNVGYRVSDTDIRDYFPHTRQPHFELSEPGIDASSVVVRYYNDSEMLMPADNAAWLLDPTVHRNLILWRAGSPVPMLSQVVRYPWVVEYKSKLAAVRGTPAIARLQLGVRTALTHYWQNRGVAQESSMLDRSLTSLLQSCKLDPADR